LQQNQTKMSVKINQSDLKLLKKKLDNLRAFDKKTLSDEIGKTALEISRLAKQNAPVDTGTLKQSIRAEKKGKTAEVVAGAKYAPYVEFGTGSQVDLSDMLELGIPESYAAQFKGKGVKNINLPARPFFFSSARIGFNDLLNRLKGQINNAIN
jgi:HK97 gp10 family phage protein